MHMQAMKYWLELIHDETSNRNAHTLNMYSFHFSKTLYLATFYLLTFYLLTILLLYLLTSLLPYLLLPHLPHPHPLTTYPLCASVVPAFTFGCHTYCVNILPIAADEKVVLKVPRNPSSNSCLPAAGTQYI